MTTTQDCSVGIGVESTYGTGVVATRWWEFTDESLTYNPERKQGQGLRVGGRVARSGRRVTTGIMSDGGVDLEAVTKGMGLLLESMFGSGVSTLVSASTYQQNFVLGDVLPSRTVQKAVIAEDGTVQQARFVGGVVDSFGFELSNQDILKIKTSWDFKGPIDTATAYAAPSYPTTPSLFHFAQAGIVFNGGAFTAPTTTALASYGTPVTPTNLLDFSLDVSNNLTGGNRGIGGAGARTSKPRPGLRDIKGKIKASLTDTVLRDAYIADTALGLILTFTTTEALGTGVATLQIAIPDLRLEGELPTSNGGDVIELDHDFTVFDGQSATQPIYVSLRTGDSAL